MSGDVRFVRMRGRIVPIGKGMLSRRTKQTAGGTLGAYVGVAVGSALAQADIAKAKDLTERAQRFAFTPTPTGILAKIESHAGYKAASEIDKGRIIDTAHRYWRNTRMERTHQWYNKAIGAINTSVGLKVFGGLALGAAAGYGIASYLTRNKGKK